MVWENQVIIRKNFMSFPCVIYKSKLKINQVCKYTKLYYTSTRREHGWILLSLECREGFQIITENPDVIKDW
jgi:hypothetical protein